MHMFFPSSALLLLQGKFLNVRRRAYRRRLNCKHEHNRISETFSSRVFVCSCVCVCGEKCWKRNRWRFDTIVVESFQIFLSSLGSAYFIFFLGQCTQVSKRHRMWCRMSSLGVCTCVPSYICRAQVPCWGRPSKHENRDNGALQIHVNQNLL